MSEDEMVLRLIEAQGLKATMDAEKLTITSPKGIYGIDMLKPLDHEAIPALIKVLALKALLDS